VKRSKQSLEDADYDKQVERLSGLPKFPHLPAAQHEIRRALRRISETDIAFIRRLIDEIVDTAAVCPTPAELIQAAGAKRHRVQTTAGKPDCEICGGSGFVTTVRKVALPGIAPYEAEFAAVCTCREGRSK
jgi:hypothetical protein